MVFLDDFMTDRLFDKTTGVENGIWQRKDTWPERVKETGNKWLIDTLINGAKEVASQNKAPIVVDIGPSSASEVNELGTSLNDYYAQIVVVEADEVRVREVRKGVEESIVRWKNVPYVYHGNGWEFGEAIALLQKTFDSASLKDEVIGVVAMNNLAIAANSVGKTSSSALIDGFMNNACDFLSPLGTISLSIGTAGLLIEGPPSNFADKNIRFVVRPGSVQESRFMGGLRTEAEYLYSKVWDVWLDALVKRNDFCFLDTSDNRIDSVVKRYSTVPTGHDFWSLPHSEEMTSFEPT